jgi:hypothetical protein
MGFFDADDGAVLDASDAEAPAAVFFFFFGGGRDFSPERGAPVVDTRTVHQKDMRRAWIADLCPSCAPKYFYSTT